MFLPNPQFKTPPDSTQIWRYIDFPKFVSMLETSAIFFPSVFKLAEDDPYEGSYARGNLDYDPEEDSSLNAEQANALKRLRPFLRNYSRDSFRQVVCVNSWYLSEYESAAMWKCYAPHGDGIAIQSTVGRLKTAIAADPKEINIGVISYEDYDRFHISEETMVAPFLYKRKSFEHERELRAICLDRDTFFNPSFLTPDALVGAPNGVQVGINVDSLIEKIKISPTAANWIRKLVEDIVRKYGLSKPIDKSSLQEGGLW